MFSGLQLISINWHVTDNWHLPPTPTHRDPKKPRNTLIWLIVSLDALNFPGTLTEDTIRRIKNIQNGTLDGIIKIHEDLCTVVSNTASAYSVWFVLHWFTYGASVLFGAICIYTQLEGTKKTREKCVGDHAVLIVILTYLFLLPCVYAARITSRCAGKTIFYTKNNSYWNYKLLNGWPFLNVQAPTQKSQ